MYPEARILGIELDAANLAVCLRNIAPYSNRSQVVHGAVWVHEGEVTYTGDSEWGLHVDHGATSSRLVPACILSALIDTLDESTVDFLQIDIEGAESELFRTAESWIRKARVLKVEIHGPFTVKACASALRRLGMSIVIDGHHPRSVIARND